MSYIDSISWWQDESRNNALGVRPRRRVFFEAPEIGACCRYIGVSEPTWAKYSRDPELAEVCAEIKSICRSYLFQLSLTDNCRGAIFNLQANYGLSEKREVDVGAATRESAERIGMGLSDKIAAIAAAAKMIESDADEV